MGCYEIKLSVYEKFTENNICVRTNGRLENGVMYSYQSFQCDVIAASMRGIRGTHLEPSIQDILDEVAPIKEDPLWG